MNRENLKRSIEEKGFDILYNAKQDYATYDILTRAPRVISLISITLGFLGLLSPFFSSQILSMLVLLIGVVGLHLDGRNDKSVIAEYENNGKRPIKYIL